MKIDGRSNPRRLRVAPPPGGKRPGDWLHKRVVFIVSLPSLGKRPGEAATVHVRSRGGSGLAIRFDDGTSCGSITDQHIRLEGTP